MVRKTKPQMCWGRSGAARLLVLGAGSRLQKGCITIHNAGVGSFWDRVPRPDEATWAAGHAKPPSFCGWSRRRLPVAVDAHARAPASPASHESMILLLLSSCILS